MLNNPSIFYYCWCYLPSLFVPGHIVPPAVTTHAMVSIHTLGLARRHTCLCPSHMCPNYIDPHVPWSHPQGPLPLPSPPPHLLSSSQLPSLPLPHSFLLTDKPPLAHPCSPPPSTHKYICFCSHLPLDLTHLHSSAHTLSHTQTPALPGQLVLGSQNLCTYTHQTIPGDVSYLSGSIPPSDEHVLPSSPEAHCPWQTPSQPHSDTLVTPTGLCLLAASPPPVSAPHALPALRIAPASVAATTSTAASAELSGPAGACLPSAVPAVPAHSGQVRTEGQASLRSDGHSCSAPLETPFQNPPRRQSAVWNPLPLAQHIPSP